MKKTSVIIVDDSALIRQLLTTIINASPDLEVVASAPNPLVAREKIRALNPDVITLDIEMPEMNGIDFLEKLMALKPTPVVMISSLTEARSELTLRALALGAVDFIAKPKIDVQNGLQDYAERICEKLRVAARARIKKPAPLAPPSTPVKALGKSSETLIMIGASTGGTEAIQEVLLGLPPDCPGILIAQHMPERFTHSFAQRLNRVSPLTVHEAQDGERILPGHAYLAPGHSHLLLKKIGGQFFTSLSDAPPHNRYRPSVDLLFHSAAQHAGKNALGILLTGMGRDGAEGLLAMRRAGAFTLAQDEESCVVFGMPREAILIGAADQGTPVSKIAERVMRHLMR